MISAFGNRCKGRIGILGGSFNPAHKGHLYISKEAIKRLKLKALWWLVSPQNPLKNAKETASLEIRLETAQAIAKSNSRIKVTDLETRWKTRFSIDSIKKLRQSFPALSPVFIIGADNLEQLPRWRSWEEILHKVPLLVVARNNFRLQPSKASCRLAKFRVKRPKELLTHKLPAWSYLPLPLDDTSSTEIRKQRSPRKSKEEALKTTEAAPKKPRAPKKKKDPDFNLSEFIIKVLDEAKAENIVNIDLTGKSSIADNMIIAEGRSQRHVSATGQILVDKLKGQRFKVRVEGLMQGDWVLIDAADTIVHLFCPEVRAFYNLERLWQNPQKSPV